MSNELSDRELATVLAALRYWQERRPNWGRLPWRTYFDDDGQTPLKGEEIDALCERLNAS